MREGGREGKEEGGGRREGREGGEGGKSSSVYLLLKYYSKELVDICGRSGKKPDLLPWKQTYADADVALYVCIPSSSHSSLD